MKLHHEFDVPASPSETLALLLDPTRTVGCLPGATFVEVADDGTWKTSLTVKLGPVGMDFTNDVRIVERNDATGLVRLAVTSRDKRGKGGADASVDATVSASGPGSTVSMDTDVKFSGQAAQLGRPSVIEDVSKRLVDQFASCLGTQLRATALDPPHAKPLHGATLLAAALRGAIDRLLHPRRREQEGGST